MLRYGPIAVESTTQDPQSRTMLRFIRRLLGRASAVDDRHRDDAELVIRRSSRSPERRASEAYFDSMSRMQAAVSSRDYEGAARLVCENLQYLPEWVKEWRQDCGSFDIRSIPALEQGGTILALVGDEQGLTQMRDIVAASPELEPWLEAVDRHHEDRRLFESVLKLVVARPNCLQTEIKGLIGEEDGRRVANVVAYLDKAGKIRRVKAGRTYRLLPAGGGRYSCATPATYRPVSPG